MKNSVKTLLAVLMAALTLSVAAVSPSYAQGVDCLGKRDIQNAVNSGQIQPLSDVLANAGIDQNQEVLSVQVCEQGGGLVYLVAVLDPSGNAQNLTLPAN